MPGENGLQGPQGQPGPKGIRGDGGGITVIGQRGIESLRCCQNKVICKF